MHDSYEQHSKGSIRKRRSIGLIAASILTLLVWQGPSFAMGTPDAWITTKVKMSLATSSGVSSTAVNVDTVDGIVTLHGKVASAAEKTQAEKLAREVSGVKEVHNILAVVPEDQQKAVQAKDDTIKDNVSNAISKDAALQDSSIKVASVDSGVVVLSGNAKTLSDHLRAIETARAVPGVKRVASEIQSPDQLSDSEIWRTGATTKQGAKQTAKNAGHETMEGAKEMAHGAKESVKGAASSVSSSASDAWITSDAKVRLMATKDVPATSINVDTNNGVVTLFGMVPNSGAKQKAETEVAKIDGVRQVKNDLQVVPQQQQAAVSENDDTIEKRISERMDSNLPDQKSKVSVDVSHGVAHLSGKVASQIDRLKIITTVRGTQGVNSVVDDLQVSSD